jgi:mono/diheme cytochrome c family protein
MRALTDTAAAQDRSLDAVRPCAAADRRVSSRSDMRRWIRRIAIGLAGVLVFAAGAAAFGVGLAERKLQRHVAVPDRFIVVMNDDAALDRGRYLYTTRGCANCHGPDGAGRVFVDDPGGLRLRAPNITPAEGSVVSRYGPADWVRAIRHGVKPDGRPLFLVPSEDCNQLTDDDLGALVAHLQRLPPMTAADGAAFVA